MNATTAGLGACLLSGAALAQPISGMTSPQVFSVSGIPNFSETFSVAQFDAAAVAAGLGGGITAGDVTLTSVEISLEINVTGGQLEFDNDGQDGGSVTADFGVFSSVTSPDVALPAISANPFVSDTFSLSGDTPNGGADGPTFDGGQSGDTDFGTLDGAALSDSDMSILLSGLAPFAGTGTVDFDVDTTTFVNFTGLSGLSSATSPANVDGEFNVKYHYTAVPTPASAALLGFGGLVAARRRRG